MIADDMDPFEAHTALFDVYLRLRPSATNTERFLDVEQCRDSHLPTHITIRPPADDKRKKAVEKFQFTRVFEEHAGQRDIFENTGILPLVEGVLGAPGREGRDGLLATLGVTGSGKSHTILGSKSQRGLTQLTLDVLFQHTSSHLVDIETSPIAFSSLCAADVSEALMMPASRFLDSVYSESGNLSRATTPALVRDSTLPHTYIAPGTFPNFSDSINSSSARPSSTVYDRLYPSLAKYQTPKVARGSVSHSNKSTRSKIAHITRSVAKKLTFAEQQDTSLLSVPSSRKYMPRISTMPQTPSVDDIPIEIDSSAEYAIVISMYEVYNDRIFDLLTASAATKTPHKRRALLFKNTEASPDRKVVAGLKKIVCSTLEEALLVLETGLHERRVAGTGSNAVSSRSHGFFCMEVKKRRAASKGLPVSSSWTSSTMTIVDLAGSERARAAKTAGSTLAEAGKINESLMYLGQCMQMLSDNANSTSPALVPFRQCKLTELMFSNSFAHNHQHKCAQKFTMIVTADPLGDYNATSQILRYSALAREVTVPRIPSVTAAYISGATSAEAARLGQDGHSSGRATPSAIQQELELALATIADLRQQLETSQILLQEETQRRQEAESSWKSSELRIDEMEAEIREELYNEFEHKLQTEQRRWRAARDAEMDAQDEHLDAKISLLTQNLSIYEDETADPEFDKENMAPAADDVFGPVGVDPSVEAVGKFGACRMSVLEDTERKAKELEAENVDLRRRMEEMERTCRQRGVLRSPSKKMRVLKTPSRKWEGSGVGLDDV
ncbi:Kinesin-like protein KIF20B [Teratosphaeria destructans]|uniref:Kinesin-like protein n=1 Tax=Teratosphaeria destructans TaxID=418781 RepID=A0A9W7W6D8_9PEZI|nr:Kinesin-like protein KIF20B [Teratosphaeria destructans]